MVKMITTTTCCCCISLRQGTLIIGWLTVIATVPCLLRLDIVSAILQLLVGIPLLYGVYKPYRPFVFWVAVLNAVGLILVIPLIPLYIYALAVNTQSETDDLDLTIKVIAYILPIIIWLLLAHILVVVVYSYSKEMERI